jgi:DNA-binding NtrC family response regulator
MPLLAEHFLRQFCEEHGRPEKRISPMALEVLKQYPWPGNVREFRNFIESMVIFHEGSVIEVGDLPTEFRTGRLSSSDSPVQIPDGEPRTMAEIERMAILETLGLTGGKRAEAAKILGIGLRTLQRKLKDYRDEGYWEE